MAQVVFNFHDVILLMTALLCLCFAVLLIATNPPKNIANYFLAGFLIAHAFIPFHELILWGAVFKTKVRDTFPQLIFVGGFAYYVDAVLLYFYVKSLVFRDFYLRKKDFYHLLPLVIFAAFMVAIFYRFPPIERMRMIANETFVYSAQYINADFICKILRAAYCAASLQLILKYKNILKTTHSNIEKVDILWLTTLVIGFLAITLMETVLSSSKMMAVHTNVDLQHHNLDVFELIGLSGYYAVFVLVCTLVFTSMRYFANFESVKQKKDREPELHKKPVQEKILNPEFAEKIDQLMRRQKPYLFPDLTLDMLAEKLGMSAKDLSMTINRHFDNNFYEFINNYRIAEVKLMLVDPKQKTKTITDIYLDVGFNSKSVFNTFFKKIVGATPSEYRISQQLKNSVEEVGNASL
ncbi:MAG: helix-turn-helix domain-containing protein [Pseudomonadota bacterium]